MKEILYLIWIVLFGLIVTPCFAARASTLIHAKNKSTTTAAPLTSTTATNATDDEVVQVEQTANVTKLTGVPQIDYVLDPNLPRELNGLNLTEYPFYNSIPEEIDFKCDGLHDGFYASVLHKCQVYHHCLFGTRYDFLCANYTAFDQRTFICHFASEVDCKNSPKFYKRNEALYKSASTTTLAPPPPPPSAPSDSSSKRRRPNRRRKPTVDYYDDYSEEYDDADTRRGSKPKAQSKELEELPAAPNKALYERPRVAPKVRRPVPINEREKYDYSGDSRLIPNKSETEPPPVAAEEEEEEEVVENKRKNKPKSGDTPISSEGRDRERHRDRPRNRGEERDRDSGERERERERTRDRPRHRPAARKRKRPPAYDYYDDDYEEVRRPKPRDRTRYVPRDEYEDEEDEEYDDRYSRKPLRSRDYDRERVRDRDRDRERDRYRPKQEERRSKPKSTSPKSRPKDYDYYDDEEELSDSDVKPSRPRENNDEPKGKKRNRDRDQTPEKASSLEDSSQERSEEVVQNSTPSTTTTTAEPLTTVRPSSSKRPSGFRRPTSSEITPSSKEVNQTEAPISGGNRGYFKRRGGTSQSTPAVPDANNKPELKVPFEEVDDPEQLAPRAPPTSITPLTNLMSSKRRPFLPSRGGDPSLLRGLAPVGAKAFTSPSRNTGIEFRTRVAAALGVATPNLHSSQYEQEEPDIVKYSSRTPVQNEQQQPNQQQYQLAPQTFYSENPKLQTNVPYGEARRNPPTSDAAYYQPLVRSGQGQVQVVHLQKPLTARRPAKASAETLEDEDYDESFNDALQPISSLHSRNGQIQTQLQQQTQTQTRRVLRPPAPTAYYIPFISPGN